MRGERDWGERHEHVRLGLRERDLREKRKKRSGREREMRA